MFKKGHARNWYWEYICRREAKNKKTSNAIHQEDFFKEQDKIMGFR